MNTTGQNSLRRHSLLASLAWILCLLCVLSTTAFAAPGKTVTPRKNGEQVNESFNVVQVFPGDAYTAEYLVNLRYKNLRTVLYEARLHPGCADFADALRLRIELPDKQTVLYDGFVRDMPTSVVYQAEPGESQLRYFVTVFLDTSAGNDYQNRELLLDFSWRYAEDEVKGDDEKLPQSGAELFGLIAAAFVFTVAGVCVIVLFTKRRGRKNHEETQ